MKKFSNKVIAYLFTVVLVLGFAACGNSGTANTKGADDAPAGDATTGEPSEVSVDWDDMAEIRVLYPSLGPIPSGLQEVEDAINEITEKKINTHVKLEMVEVGNSAQQVGLIMSASEPIDLMLSLPSGPASFTALKAQNQLSDITELLDEYGTDIKDILGEKLKGTSVDKKVYAVTGNRTYVISTYIMMRTDVLEDLGLLEKARNMTTLAEYDEILSEVKKSEKWGHLAGIVSSDGQGTVLGIEPGFLGENNFSDMDFYDSLGDTGSLVFVDGDGNDTTVKGLFGSDEYANVYEIMRDWNEKGYIYSDILTNNEMAEQLVKSNVAFSYIGNCEAGVETLKSTDCGMPMTCVKLKSYPIRTGSLTKFVWTVPGSAKEPEAAVAFLNLMFTDADISNLLSWGIEGRDYVIVDGQAAYPDGVETAPYHTSDFLFGNQFLTLPWQGDGAEFRKECEAIEKSATMSPYLGFTADTTSVTNEIATLTNVIMEYRGQIGSGSASPDVYSQFLEKLDTCGIDKVIAVYQEQLNQWLSEN